MYNCIVLTDITFLSVENNLLELLKAESNPCEVQILFLFMSTLNIVYIIYI